MNEHGRRFAWQEGYGGFSVSVSNTATVAKYIRDLLSPRDYKQRGATPAHER